MDSSTKTFLERTPVGNIKKEIGKLITVSSTDSVAKVMQTLANSGITAAPVFDASAGTFVAFVDVLDLAMFACKVFASNYQEHPHLYDPKQLEDRFSLSVVEVINASNRDPFLPVSNHSNLAFLINNFLRFVIHRVPVSSDDRVVGIVSQSDVVKFLQKHPQEIRVQRSKTLTELGLDKGNVITITNNEPLIKAFTTILSHKISGLAVIDFQTGQILNNLSASDLKGLTQGSFFKLEVPIHQIFLYSGGKLPAVTCSPNSNLGEVIDLFEKTGVHRVYVVDGLMKPLNVISLTDVLNVFTTPFAI